METVSGAGRLGSVRTRVERGEALEEARAEEAPCIVASHPDGVVGAEHGRGLLGRQVARQVVDEPAVAVTENHEAVGLGERRTAPMPSWYGSQCTTEP